MYRKLYIFFLLSLLTFFTSCFVKREKLRIPTSYKNAKNLTGSQVLKLLERESDSIKNIIIKKGKFKFVALSEKKGVSEKFPVVSGILIADFKGDLRFQVFAPVVKSCVFDILQRGNIFKIWYPRKRTLYVGNSLNDLDVSGVVGRGEKLKYNLKNIRPAHLFEIFFLNFSGSENYSNVLVEELNSKFYKYYLVTEVKSSREGYLIPVREYLIERSSLKVYEKKVFDGDGKISGEVFYYNYKKVNGIDFPTYMVLKRERDGYEVEISIKEILINSKLPEKAFILNLPEKYKIKKLTQERVN